MIIDFVEPRRPSRAAWIVAGSLWMLVVVLASLHVFLQARIARLQEAQRAGEDQARMHIVAAKPRVVAPYQAEATAALKRAALPEAAAFAELEHVAVAGIQVNSIDDNPSVSTVTVELDAVSDVVLIDYVGQLNAGMPEARWHIRQVSAIEARSMAFATEAAATAPGKYMRRATIYRDF